MSTRLRNLRDEITHWRVSTDGYGGWTYDLPDTFAGRWEDHNTTFRDAQGEEVVSNAIVYLEKDVAIGDFIAQGAFIELDPTTVGGFRVRQFNKMTDLRRIEIQRKAFL